MKIIASAWIGLLCLGSSSVIWPSPVIEKAKTEKLNLAISLPRDENVFFQTTPFIALDNEKNIYALDNRQHVIIKLDSSGRLVSRIGRQGQGPGELQWPAWIQVWNKAIFVADNTSISVFNLEGHFQRRFRRFHKLISMAVSNDRVFLAETGDDKIINVYNYEGKKLFSFGNKYSVDYAIYKGWPTEAIDGWINHGILVCSGSKIYFITSLFGDIFAYDLKGNLVASKSIENNKFIERNRSLYFKKGIINKGDGAFFHNKLLEDACYYQGKIFVLLSSPAGNSCGEDIWEIDERTLQVIKTYVLFNKNQRDKNWPRSLVVTSNQAGENLFYVSLFDGDDFLINIYK